MQWGSEGRAVVISGFELLAAQHKKGVWGEQGTL